MEKLLYSINEVYISKFGFCINEEFVPSYPETYYLVRKIKNRYKAVGETDSLYYPMYETATEEEKENCCLWEKIESIYPYLTEKELQTKLISLDRIYEIANIKNNVILDKTPVRKRVGNVIPFNIKK